MTQVVWTWYGCEWCKPDNIWYECDIKLLRLYVIWCDACDAWYAVICVMTHESGRTWYRCETGMMYVMRTSYGVISNESGVTWCCCDRVWYGCEVRDVDVIWCDLNMMGYKSDVVSVWYRCFMPAMCLYVIWRDVRHLGVIWCDLILIWYESDVTWYRCDMGVIYLWRAWYGVVLCDVIWKWCDVMSVWYVCDVCCTCYYVRDMIMMMLFQCGLIQNWCGVISVQYEYYIRNLGAITCDMTVIWYESRYFSSVTENWVVESIIYCLVQLKTFNRCMIFI